MKSKNSISAKKLSKQTASWLRSVKLEHLHMLASNDTFSLLNLSSSRAVSRSRSRK
ncbi:MAG TPA: hypothetical protein VHC95_13275 [Opitutales bacterium]|nr:hypothetical protein [Opitutales bacterium]